MGVVTVHAEYKTKVPPQAAVAWNFDLDAHDHQDPRFHAVWGKPKASDGRTILSRSANSVKVRDVFGGRPMEFTTSLAGDNALHVEGSGQGWNSKSTLVFKADGQGSRVVHDTTMSTRGMASLMMVILGAKFKKNLQDDVRTHLAIMDEAWAQKSW